jgi:hypothetical protein
MKVRPRQFDIIRPMTLGQIPDPSINIWAVLRGSER